MNIYKITDNFLKLATEYSLSEMKKDWNQYAETDPYYAIIRAPNKKGKWSEKEFYNSGIEDVKNLMNKCKELQLPQKKEKALDFGCGVGRLTEPLAKYFSEIIGVDISDEMIKLAKKRDKHSNIEYKVLDSLSSIKDNSIDFIITRFVIEHIPPNLAKKYIKEFTRILSKDGLATFDMPFDEPKSNKPHNKKYIEKGEKEDIPITLVFSIPKNEIYKIIKDKGCNIIDSGETLGLVNEDFPAQFYWITK